MPERLRVGVVCVGDEVEAAFAASIRELLAVDGVEPALVIAEPAPRGRRLPRSLWEAYLRVRPLRTISSRRPVDLPAELDGVPRVAAQDLAAIRAQRPDIVLRFSSGSALPGVAEHGTWAFSGSGEHPPAFAELLGAQAATGVILQRLGDGAVLHRCFVSTKPAHYRKTLDAATWAATFMPARAAGDLIRGTTAELDAGPGAAVAPTSAETVRCAARATRAWVAGQLRSILLLERWHVGIVRQPIERFLDEAFVPEIEWLPTRRRRGFYADPFLAQGAGTTQLLMEDFDDAAGRATIVGVELERGLGGSPPRAAIDCGTHMSYPFVVEHDGRVLCIPETHERRGVFLYALDETGRWAEEATLIEGRALLDATVVEHGGRWWMFCTDSDAGSDGKLFVWWAPALRGPWEPHAGNPVKADVRSSRPAGTPFVVDGELYRPAQDSAGGYGSAVVICRVTRLTTTEFAEVPVARFAAPPGDPYPSGRHTLAGSGGLTAVDGKRDVLAPGLVVPRIAGKLRRLAARVLGYRSSSAA